MKTPNAIRGLLPSTLCGLFIGFLLQSAHATQYNFSYLFDDGTTIAGTLDGSASGNFVTGVSNVSFTINGNPVGPVDVWGYYGAPTFALSFDPTQNNFWFAEAGGWNGNTQIGNLDYEFALIGSAITTPNANTFGNDFDSVYDLANSLPQTQFPGHQMNGLWSLTAASVPDGGTSALMLGLGLIGIAVVKLKLR